MITEQFLPPANGTATPLLPPADGTAAPCRRHRPWLLQDLERPGDIFRDLGPNWFASVMGTGIVAIAASSLPFRVTGLHVFALVVWALAAAWLLALSAAWAVHWTRYTARAREHADNPVMAQFWGAPPMALMTVGTGTLLLGKAWMGAGAAVDADWTLWGLGTALGLVTACWIPYLMMTRHEIAPDGAFGGWLMPVVPPMVSAANGALLVPYAAAGQARQAMLLGCYAMFGISLFMSVIIITLLWGRLVTYKTLPAAMAGPRPVPARPAPRRRRARSRRARRGRPGSPAASRRGRPGRSRPGRGPRRPGCARRPRVPRSRGAGSPVRYSRNPRRCASEPNTPSNRAAYPSKGPGAAGHGCRCVITPPGVPRATYCRLLPGIPGHTQD
jgi:hypothetical protein